MSHVTLVRHGQANSAARTEGDYDRLSDLGHQQAAWLGEHFRDAGETFARAYCGTLRRHAETAAAMGAEDLVIDPRLNELEYFTLSQLLEQQQGVAVGDPASAGQLTDLTGIDGRLSAEIEPFQSAQEREAGDAQPHLDAPLLLVGHLLLA